MLMVLSMSAPFKVLDSIVEGIAVDVVDFWQVVWVGDPGRRDQAMNVEMLLPVAIAIEASHGDSCPTVPSDLLLDDSTLDASRDRRVLQGSIDGANVS